LAAQVALPKLFERFPALALDTSSPVMFHGFVFRGPKGQLCQVINWVQSGKTSLRRGGPFRRLAV
jgi:hypothetical protein